MSSALAVAIGVVAGRANAEPDPPAQGPAPFGSSGQFVLSVDGLAGVSVNVLRSKGTGLDGSSVYDNGSATNVTASFFGSQYAAPGLGGIRWGADVFVASGLSLGGTVSFTSNSSENESSFWPANLPAAKQTRSSRSFVLSPRVGYARPLGSNWAIWPRLGVDWINSKNEIKFRADVPADSGASPTYQSTYHGNAVNAAVDVKFVFSPISHVALFAGPFAKLPIFNRGNQELNGGSLESSTKVYELGAAAGVLVYF